MRSTRDVDTGEYANVAGGNLRLSRFLGASVAEDSTYRPQQNSEEQSPMILGERTLHLLALLKVAFTAAQFDLTTVPTCFLQNFLLLTLQLSHPMPPQIIP